MKPEFTCPDCGTTVESKARLAKGHEVSKIEFGGEDVSLYENDNLFLCKNCKRPLGVPK